MARPKAEAKKCSTVDCNAAVLAKGLCSRCYNRDYQRRKREGKTAPRKLGDGFKPTLPEVGGIAPRRAKRPQEDGPISTSENLPSESPTHPKKRAEKPRSPSVISARSRAAIERTKLTRAALDAIIATDEPDPEIDSLPVVDFGPPRLTRAAREAIEAAEESGEEYVPEEPRKHPRLRCSECQKDGHQAPQCPDLRTRIRDIVEESSNVTAIAP